MHFSHSGTTPDEISSNEPATRCSLFGLDLQSELALSGMAPSDPALPTVIVRFGTITATGSPLSLVAKGILQLEIPGVGRYRIANGEEIVIDPAPGATERKLRVFLLGSAFGALLHQRGLLPLHANAVEIGGRAVAIAGRSGAGKSTLAAWFADAGYPVLCDDVCAIETAAGEQRVLPGVPRLRLWRDALERSGRDTAAFERSFDERDKFDLPVRALPVAATRPLAACYILGEAEDGDAPSIERLDRMRALEALIAQTYRGRFVRVLGKTQAHLATCLAIAAATPVFLLNRRWSVEQYDEQARRLEAHARQLVEARPST